MEAEGHVTPTVAGCFFAFSNLSNSSIFSTFSYPESCDAYGFFSVASCSLTLWNRTVSAFALGGFSGTEIPKLGGFPIVLHTTCYSRFSFAFSLEANVGSKRDYTRDFRPPVQATDRTVTGAAEHFSSKGIGLRWDSRGVSPVSISGVTLTNWPY